MPAASGDVAVVRTKGWGAFLIRLGARLRRQPHTQNHVVIVVDNLRTTVEAWPGGVRKGSLDDYDARFTSTNFAQPKTAEQRQAVVDVATSLLSYGYNWAAIARDTANVFDLDRKSRQWATSDEPTSFVCSSLADYIYFKVGLPCPNEGEETTPADWAAFILRSGWNKVVIPPQDPRTAIPGVMSPEPKG